MFKKPENEFTTPEPPANIPRPARTEPRKESATIGPSISVKGDLTGEEDLVIQGRVEGKVDLKEHCVTIGKEGQAKADIYGKLISVEGEVEGNLFGQDQIVVRSSGNVRGNISAPRVTIEDGARFKGSIDMESRSADRPRAVAPIEAKASAAAAPGGDRIPRAGFSSGTEVNGPRT